MRYPSLQFKRALLECFGAEGRAQHRVNVLGRPAIQVGTLETRMGVALTAEERAAAQQALNELEASGLIRATFTDLVEPLNWLEITDAGRAALARNALDRLDAELTAIDPQLVEIRHGAWSAAHGREHDSARNVAHSGRELQRQTLARLAPDEEVRQASWHQGEKVTRRDRLKLILEKRNGRISQSRLGVIERQWDLTDALYERLSAIAHGPVEDNQGEAIELLKAVEAALTSLLGAT